MATMTATANTVQFGTLLDANRHDALGFLLSAALPLAAFVVAQGVADLAQVQPLYFAPFGLPGWISGAFYLLALPLFGTARWLVAEAGQAGRTAGWWLVSLMAGTIAFPFLVTPLDTLALSIVSMALLIIGIGAGIRTAKVSQLAGLLMLPGLAWMGLSAFVGLGFVAGWTPPFGLTNANTGVNAPTA
jgi:tryptophan-rich sensory protein